MLGIRTTLPAQTLTVLDRTTLLPLEGATVTSDPPGLLAITDARGRADLEGFARNATISITHLGYTALVLPPGRRADTTVYLLPRTTALDEVVISASRFLEPRRDAPEHIDLLDRRAIAASDAPTTPAVLQNSGLLFVQQSQMGGGSPVIRGFEASRVLLVVDGVRMNNAIYRSGHLQDLLSVDPNALERIEVISGPGSVVYGSDALGGVVHLVTRVPRFTDTTGVNASGSNWLRASSANASFTAHATVELRGRRWAGLTGISAGSFGDLRQGNQRGAIWGDHGLRTFTVRTIDGVDSVVANPDPNVQGPSGYQQIDLLQKVLHRSRGGALHGLNLQLSTGSELPRYDRLSEFELDSTGVVVPAQAEWYYGPPRRVLAAYTLEWERVRGTFSKARITPSYQWIEQSRHTRGYGSAQRGHRTERVGVFGLSADFEKGMGRHELRYGAEHYANTVSSTAYREHIVTGVNSYLATRYPNGGSTMHTTAAFFLHTFEASERFILSAGLRFSAVELRARFNNPDEFDWLNGEFAQRNTAFNWRFGTVLMPGTGWRLSALVSTGFRAPNVDDLAKVFDSTPGTVIVPNPHLRPETTTNFELGVEKILAGRHTMEVSLFHSLYHSALVVGDHTFNGADSIDYDGVLSRVTALTNAREAYLHGAQARVELAFSERLTFRSTLTYTYGRIRTDSTDLPLDHVPPLYGRTGLEWQAKRVRAECYALYNGWKHPDDYSQLSGSEDNLRYATERGTPAWYTVNVRCSFAFTQKWSAQAACENVLDTYYRTFSSGISAPGRNVQMSVRFMW